MPRLSTTQTQKANELVAECAHTQHRQKNIHRHTKPYLNGERERYNKEKDGAHREWWVFVEPGALSFFFFLSRFAFSPFEREKKRRNKFQREKHRERLLSRNVSERQKSAAQRHRCGPVSQSERELCPLRSRYYIDDWNSFFFFFSLPTESNESRWMLMTSLSLPGV